MSSLAHPPLASSKRSARCAQRLASRGRSHSKSCTSAFARLSLGPAARRAGTRASGRWPGASCSWPTSRVPPMSLAALTTAPHECLSAPCSWVRRAWSARRGRSPSRTSAPSSRAGMHVARCSRAPCGCSEGTLKRSRPTGPTQCLGSRWTPPRPRSSAPTATSACGTTPTRVATPLLSRRCSRPMSASWRTGGEECARHGRGQRHLHRRAPRARARARPGVPRLARGLQGPRAQGKHPGPQAPRRRRAHRGLQRRPVAASRGAIRRRSGAAGRGRPRPLAQQQRRLLRVKRLLQVRAWPTHCASFGRCSCKQPMAQKARELHARLRTLLWQWS
mmetsp:Transcript_89236/g.288922  ORF Transcript_89236/g.288922 Transcript_89236/m.288922 type:complete len:334 (+) Transcript_89236:904-1905(+)